MDPKTEELCAAHDVIAEVYAERLADALDRMPVDRVVLDLFCELVLAAGEDATVGDLGCGTGRLEPYLAAKGLRPRGVDLSPGMLKFARRDYPEFEFDLADLRDLPFADGSLAGVVCWYSLMYLTPEDRTRTFRELSRVLRSGGHFVTAYKAGDGQLTRGGRSLNLGVEFDLYWLSPEEMTRRATEAGMSAVFWCGRPAEDGEASPQAYLIARKS